MEKAMMKFVQRFLKDDNGATMIEYGLIISLISLVLIATLNNLGSKLKSTFMAVQNGLQH